jgi:hypothetical protein
MSIQRLRPAPARFDGPYPVPYTSRDAAAGLPAGHIMFQVDPDTAAVLPAERRGGSRAAFDARGRSPEQQ